MTARARRPRPCIRRWHPERRGLDQPGLPQWPGRTPHRRKTRASLLLGRRDTFMSEVVGRVGLGGANVLRCKVRVIVENVFNAVARSETAQNVLDGDARPDDHWLPHHNLRIALDAWVLHV